ncbi:methyltransferase domain protein [Dictyocaulus viviparus]|uniref:Methyltransferase domain protein n=1 Tax=Dictyocaulus viviparus TaxID=29172 RepID=A0A0D8XPV6_DICVI|nr:methyltransferase domain protein [Dictyocaulus viviparus]
MVVVRPFIEVLRRNNFQTEFVEEHDRLFNEAKCNGDHRAVTSHYYSMMSTVIEEYFGGNFHFAPPHKENLSLDEALMELHRKIGERLGLCEGMTCVDLGCGIGGVIKDLASTGANLMGITIAANEVKIGNEELRKLGIESTCRLVEGHCQRMPFEDESKDSAYAVYSLKYVPCLDGIMREVSRILKPDGRFLIYDLIKTEKYDEKNNTHIEIIEGLEYACGMPSLHTKAEMMASAERFNLVFEGEEDLEETNGRPFHYCFSHSSIFMWLVESPFIGSLISVAQKLRILPRGFQYFNRIFLSGTVEKIVNGGRLGILSGSKILVFKKKK